MSWQGSAGRVLWVMIFLAIGVLPAVVLALLSLIPAQVDSHAKLWSALAWAGTLGLLLAAFNRPASTEPAFLLVIVAALTLGLVAMSPTLPGTFAGMTEARVDKTYWVLALAFFGPVAAALLYIVQALRWPDGRQRRSIALTVLGIAGGAALIQMMMPSPPKQVIEATASTDEVTLVVDEPAKLGGTSMGLDNLSKLPYSRIYYDGRVYTPVSHGARVSVPWQGAHSRYVITEKVDKNPRSDRWPVRVTWTLEDRESAKVMATRELWRRDGTPWSADTPSGWQGDHAARFVEQVLRPQQPALDRTSLYREAAFDAEIIAPLSLTLSKQERATSGCEERVKIVTLGFSQRVQSLSPDWQFEPSFPPDQVFCAGADVYVISGPFADSINIDRLNSQGQLIEQLRFTTAQTSVTNGFLHKQVMSLAASQQGVELQVAYFRKYPGAGKPVPSDLALRIRSK
jgi:hypothetical protein